MSKKTKKSLGVGWIILIIFTALACFGLLIASIVKGKNIALFNPQGYIANEQHKLMLTIVAILLAVAIPVLLIAYSIAWKYRESNIKAVTTPTKNKGKSHAFVMWIVPVTIMVMIVSVMLPATYRLAPQKTLADDKNILKIKVISLRWKWLFIYPDQGIATVNFVQIPVNTAVEFEMTADETPMSSFWIPNLGGQLYTMTSHVNRLNLLADTTGDYPGSTPEINGIGFSGMRFIARVSNNDDFLQWVQSVEQSPKQLDSEAYEQLLKPSERNPVAYYSTFKDDLYDKVLMKYNGHSEGQMYNL